MAQSGESGKFVKSFPLCNGCGLQHLSDCWRALAGLNLRPAIIGTSSDHLELIVVRDAPPDRNNGASRLLLILTRSVIRRKRFLRAQPRFYGVAGTAVLQPGRRATFA